jgi:hypothetical protein
MQGHCGPAPVLHTSCGNFALEQLKLAANHVCSRTLATLAFHFNFVGPEIAFQNLLGQKLVLEVWMVDAV